MKISMISTVKNEEKNIEKFINSIIKQSKKPDELLIVDGGSKDQTYNILKEYSKKYSWIKIYQLLGANIATGRNFAINKSKGEIIFVSDAGCILNHKWIQDTIKYFPEKNVVAGNYGAITRNNFEFFQSQIVIKKVNRPSRMSSRNIAFKKDCWKKAGGYPEKSLTGEDTKFNLKLIENKCKIAINSKKLVSWEMRPTIKSFANQFYRYGQGDKLQGNLKNLKLNFLMLYGCWTVLSVIILLLFVDPLISLILTLTALFYLFVYSIKVFIKTKRLLSLFYIPLLELIKRISYILGATFG